MSENTEQTDITFKTQSQAANYFGVNRRTFAEWQASGCPGSPNKYELRPIVLWMIEQRRNQRW